MNDLMVFSPQSTTIDSDLKDIEIATLNYKLQLYEERIHSLMTIMFESGVKEADYIREIENLSTQLDYKKYNADYLNEARAKVVQTNNKLRSDNKELRARIKELEKELKKAQSSIGGT